MPIQLSENAITVLEQRYLLKNALGEVTETPQKLFERIAKSIALAEKRDRGLWSDRYFEMMSHLRFLPNSPTLMNAGIKGGQLSACYVLPIEDSLDGIFTTLKSAALIHQSGGGTGFSFSRIRASGSRVNSSMGVASGPVSFMRIFDVATDTIKQGGTRRGANMAILRIDHPEVFEFIDSKRDLQSITNFNISVGMSDLFMDRLATGGKFDLVDPRSGKVARSVLAQELFDRLAQAAWETGDPGVVFLDRMNRFNPTPRAGAFESTNPCGEQPLLPFESCNLGSLNLSCYWSGDRIDWPLLARDVWSSVRFLDAVIDVNQYPVIECKKITLRNRKIGLGVMGFADLLLLMGLAYDSLEGRDQGERLMSFINREAKAASAELARRKGAFPNWRGSLWQSLGYPQLRNATVSTVAPTGTISIIAGCSSGIEPVFAGTFERNVLSGRKLRQTHTLSTRSGKAWRTAMEISVEDHVKMQAVFQRHSDSAVSKTINMPKSATVEQVKKAYLLAYQLGCKGITVYRDQCRKDQVLVESPVCDTCVD